MTCASCGFAASPDFAFCPRCGFRLTAEPPSPPSHAPSRTSAAPAAEADRRIASVLFADLSGFTTLSERLDPEDVRALQTELIRELSGAVERYHGFIEKYVGDAVLAVFGAPVAHEDDVERALDAALLMRERVDRLSESWQRRIGAPLALHIGVNTGAVVAGQVGVGTAAAAYAVTGDAVNTAARLQSAAGPGEIVVGESTFRMASHAFDFEDVGTVALKGKSEPAKVYRLRGPLALRRRARGAGAYGSTTPFVARGEELEALRRAFDGMRAGRTQVARIVGEAGAGKSRLQSEFLARLKLQGFLEGCAVRVATCASTGEQPYGVVAALLREAYDIAEDDTLAAAHAKIASGLRSPRSDAAETAHLAGLLGHILGLVVDDRLVHHVEPDQLKRQLYVAARAAVERRLEDTALLLIVEDLHWADAASIELLAFTLDQLGDRHLMLLATQRAAPYDDAFGATRAEHTTIRLDPLDARDCDRLLHGFLGDADASLPEAVRNDIIGRAGGNPLFLEELLRALIERGVLSHREGRWIHRADVDVADVPLTLHGLLLSHIDRLPPALRAVLQEAAVIGNVISEDVLRAIGGRADTAGALAELVAAEMLVVDAGGEDDERARRTYRFRHALLQEAVYQNLLMRRRTELHTRVGATLERMSGGSPQRLEEVEALGHHWSLSEDRPRGARYLIAAGDWAKSIFANEDALRHYRRALATLSQCDGGDAALPSVNERLGDVYGIVGQRTEAVAHYEAALACHERLGDDPARARQHRKIAESLWSAGDRAGARDRLRDALALLDGSGDAIERAHVYQTMGRHAFRSGDARGAADWAAQALEEGRAAASGSPAGEPRPTVSEAIAHALNTMGVALARLGRMREAAEHLEHSVALALEKELHQAACRGLANLAVLHSTLDPRRAIETCTLGLETAKKIGDFALQSRLYSNLAVAYCALTNRCDEHGIGAAQAAIDLDRRLGQLDHLTVPLIVLGQIQQCHGDPGAAVSYYREALALAERTGEPQLLFPCYEGLATVYLEAGDEAEAERYMIQAQAVCERAGVEPDALVVLPFLD